MGSNFGMLFSMGMPALPALVIPPFDRDAVIVGPNRDYATITGGLKAAGANGVCYVAPKSGGYAENIVVPYANQKLIGLDGPGAVYNEAASGVGLYCAKDDFTMINVGQKGTTYSVQLHACARPRILHSKLEGGDIQVLMTGSDSAQVADAWIGYNELCWGAKGIHYDNSSYGYPTQIRQFGNLFHNLTTDHLGIEAAGLVVDLWHYNNVHARDESGNAPTDFILLSDNGNIGVIAGNHFQHPTNEAAVLTIGTGLKWGANSTEAGWSTARPA